MLNRSGNTNKETNMSKKITHAMFHFFLTVALFATPQATIEVFAQEPDQAPKVQAEHPELYDSAAMEAAWKATMSPGEPHQWLEKMAGDWTFETSMWMNPEAPPEKSTGEAKKSMIMEGRYLQEEMSGEMMGLPFTGRGIIGFDNVTQEVVASWIDNMSTGLATTRGKIDTENQRMVAHGEMAEPVSGNTMQLKMVTSVVDHDHHTFEYYVVLPDGHEMKQMEIHYTRKGNS
jgi:hypothetical protein